MKSLGLNPKKNMRIKTAPDKKVNLIDIAEELVHEIDQIRQSIGVDRAALIKIRMTANISSAHRNPQAAVVIIHPTPPPPLLLLLLVQ